MMTLLIEDVSGVRYMLVSDTVTTLTHVDYLDLLFSYIMNNLDVSMSV